MARRESHESADGALGRVLLVDDEEALRRALSRKLRKEGYVVVEAGTGQRALAILDESAFDVIVSDITMPDMDGVELLRRARANKPEIRVVLMTGAPEISTAIKAVEYGAFEYLVKPSGVSYAATSSLFAAGEADCAA